MVDYEEVSWPKTSLQWRDPERADRICKSHSRPHTERSHEHQAGSLGQRSFRGSPFHTRPKGLEVHFLGAPFTRLTSWEHAYPILRSPAERDRRKQRGKRRVCQTPPKLQEALSRSYVLNQILAPEKFTLKFDQLRYPLFLTTSLLFLDLFLFSLLKTPASLKG